MKRRHSLTNFVMWSGSRRPVLPYSQQMDIFEYAEVHYPARTAQQEEEEAVESTASANLELPIVLWNAQLRQQLFPDGIVVGLVVVATSRASCALLARAFCSKQVLGSVVLPEVSMRGLVVPSSLRDRTCTIYVVPGQAALLVACQHDVPGERAHAVCSALLGEVCPEHVLVLGSLRAEAYRGEGDASQEALTFRLASTPPGAVAPAGQHPVATLPTGNVIGGLPAAILSWCQVRGMASELVVDIEMVPSLQPDAVRPLAAAAKAVLHTAAGAHTAGGHPAHTRFGGACRAVADALTAQDTIAGAYRDMIEVTASSTGGLAGVYV